MKVLKIIGHPYTLMLSFSMILISGEHLGGFYVLYLLLALPIAAPHSILAVIGIALLLISFHRFGQTSLYGIKVTLNLIGLLLLITSIYSFFINDKEHYNYGTFHQTVPLMSLMLFGFIALSFFISSLQDYLKHKAKGSGVSLPDT